MGVILYEMVAGRRPFKGSVASIFGQIVTSEPEPPSTWRPGLPFEIDALCLKAIEKAITHRYSSAAQFAENCPSILRQRRTFEGTLQLHAVDIGPASDSAPKPTPKTKPQQTPEIADSSNSRMHREAELRQVTVAVYSFEPDENSLSDVSTSQSEQLHDQAQSLKCL